MTIFMLMFFTLIYTRCMRKDIKLTQFLLLISFVFKTWPHSIDISGLPVGTSETSFSFMLTHPSRIVPPPGVPL